MVKKNITILSKQEYDDVWVEYVEMINTSIITKGDHAIDSFWNVYNSQKYPDRKRGKFTNRFISEDDRKDMISGKNFRNSKDNFTEKKRKHNASLTVFYKTNTKLEYFC